MRRLWPLGALILAIFVSSSAVITPKQFTRSVVAYSPFPLTEAGFGRFWFDWWWLFVKGWHATEFAIVYLAIRHAMNSRRPGSAFLITAALAAGDEIHQRWVSARGAHASDWLIDVLGIAICAVIVDLKGLPTSWAPWARVGLRASLGILALLLIRILALHPFWRVSFPTMGSTFVMAAERGDLAELETLIAAGADLNQRDTRSRTAVMAATHARRAEVVRLLIEAGANVDLQDERRDNVFLYAGAEGLLDILRLAVKAGASTTLTNRYGGSALIPAAERGHVEVVREILTTTDVDVNHVNNLGWTALLEAIILSDGGPRHQEIVRLLIEHGAEVDLADREGVTPLQHARQRGYREIEQMLRKARAV